MLGMKATFKNSHPQLGERTLQVDLTAGGNYFGIVNSNVQAIVMLTDTQLEEMRLFLNKWSESK